MYAVIEIEGQQHKVSQGDVIKVQKITSGDTQNLDLNKVLLVVSDEHILVGTPYVEKASVKAEIQGEEKASKVLVYKQKPRKGYRKLRGHRQGYTVLKIKDISIGG